MSAAERLVHQRRVRGAHEKSANKMLREADEILESDAPDTSDALTRLAQLKQSLMGKLDDVKLVDNEIVALIEQEDELAEYIEQVDSFKANIYKALAKIERLFLKRADMPKLSSHRAETQAKLPKLALRPFNGDVTQWMTFWDSFQSAVHNNEALSDIDKFNYLRSLVERSAKEAIAGLTLTSANYTEAISILEKRFGNKKQIISKHMDALLSVDAVNSQQNVKGLRRLYDQLEIHIRGLRALGVESETYGSLLSSILLKKLPPELQLLVSRELTSDDWTLETLMGTLVKEIEARERAATTTQHHIRPGREQHTSATLFTGDQRCCYCNQGHMPRSCPVVVQPEARKLALKKAGRCFICLKKGHVSPNCRSGLKCEHCGSKHHVSICFKKDLSSPLQPQKSASNATLNPEANDFTMRNQSNATLLVEGNTASLLQTARATVYNPTQPEVQMRVRIVLDTGSQRSYVSSTVQNQLNLPSKGKRSMIIATFGTSRGKWRGCEHVELGIELGKGCCQVLNVFSVPTICEPITGSLTNRDLDQFSHLRHLELSDPNLGDEPQIIDILIGSDYYWDIVSGNILRGPSGPVAVHTKLGWVLSGPVTLVDGCDDTATLVTHTLMSSRSNQLEESLRSFWEVESFGIHDRPFNMLERFDENIVFDGERYEVPLPWKTSHPNLPDNYQLSHKRLMGLIRRLKLNPDLFKEYDDVIRDQIRKGIVEIVDSPEMAEGGRMHYLPHHAVIRQDKTTTKLRIVYDASAKEDGLSLNNCLHTGPKFGQKIFDILLRFRVHRTALSADIEKAFLMIAIRKQDRDVLRFLWVKNIEEESPDLQVLRFTRVVFGVVSSPFILNATLHHHIKQSETAHPDVVNHLLRSVYVDDVVFGSENDEKAYELFTASKELMKRGGFNLRKYVTNSEKLQAKIDRVEKPSDNVCKEKAVLGLRWNIETDEFIFTVPSIEDSKSVVTKRYVVHTVGRFFDPIGIVSPIVVRFKMFFQELCEAHVEWDQPLSGALLSRWNALVTGLKGCRPIHIKRCYYTDITESITSQQLYGFCDASKGAYAAVVYLLICTENDQIVRFVTSKTRVAPRQGQTIPRLELLSALLLSRLITSVAQCLRDDVKLDKPICYADSQVALHWIWGTDKVWKQFVQNRVNEIRSLTDVSSWKHCSGEDNPADIPSRGASGESLFSNVIWFNGPAWLCDSNKFVGQDVPVPDECLSELKSERVEQTCGMLTLNTADGISQLIDVTKYNDLYHLLRLTRLVYRFVRVISKNTRWSVVQELIKAELEWVKDAQIILINDKNFPLWKKQFKLFIDDDGIWRCGGRLANIDAPYTTRFPALLPRTHHFTKLIVQNAHRAVLHNGVKETLTELRMKYWIVKGRSFIKLILRQCTLCKRFEGAAYQGPPAPPLPICRVEEAPPFAHTGVDFAGPLYVKMASTDKCTSKVWVCLYTCCATRAVHLDIVPNLSSFTFFRCFKRFTARRGIPTLMISDNGKTFKAAALIVKQILDQSKLHKSLAKVRTEWRFNVERAPWWGGFFERLVKSTKRCLKKIIGKSKLTYEELLTAVIEVEAIINSRPLSYVSMDDLEEPLTPSHLLVGRRLLSIPDHIPSNHPRDYNTSNSELNDRMRHLNNILDHFWTRWKKEYLLELRECHRHPHQTRGSDKINVGDVVVVHEDGKHRGFWKLGRVEKLLVGQDGESRGAVVKVHQKEGHCILLRRPVQKLFPIEVNSADTCEDEILNVEDRDENKDEDRNEEPQTVLDPFVNDKELTQDVDDKELTQDISCARRSTRAAAQRARDRILAHHI